MKAYFCLFVFSGSLKNKIKTILNHYIKSKTVKQNKKKNEPCYFSHMRKQELDLFIFSVVIGE